MGHCQGLHSDRYRNRASAEGLSQKVLSDKNNIPSSGSYAGAGVRHGEMEPLFLLLLRRFHVPTVKSVKISTVCRNGGMS